VIGRKLGPYEVLEKLGEGGMGEVYEARDTRLGRTVAIKVLPPHATAPDDLRRRFEKESRAIATLNHPHICVLFDIGRQDDVDFMVMERLEGESLHERLTRGALTFEESLRHAIAIADALEQAQRRGVVHRDIKPGNIMLTRTGVKLLDFGLAQLRPQPSASDDLVTVSMTGVGIVMGTPQYMAPEQIEGKEADVRSDIFALGSVLYEMLTGRRAFAGDTSVALAASILKGDPPAIPSHLPPALARTLSVCWAKDPDERWQSAGDLRRELEWIAAGGGRPVAEAAPAPHGVRRRQAIAWGTAALLGATAGASLFSR
jgi:serine/threonine protein kinase